MDWYKAYDKITPYMVRVESETGFGTGFLFGYNANHSIAAFATACHVVDNVEEWKKPIRIRHYSTNKVVYFEDAGRVIFADRLRDTATILVSTNSFDLPPATLPLLPSDKFKKIGVEVGWTGFPSLSPSDLCFFSGTVSFYQSSEATYLIDGVAINGVSGGPVFSTLADSTPQIIGVISAYVANIRGGDTLPGLLKARDLTTVHNHIKTIKSFDEAKQKEDQFQKQSSDVSPANSPVKKESDKKEPIKKKNIRKASSGKKTPNSPVIKKKPVRKASNK